MAAKNPSSIKLVSEVHGFFKCFFFFFLQMLIILIVMLLLMQRKQRSVEKEREKLLSSECCIPVPQWKTKTNTLLLNSPYFYITKT